MKKLENGQIEATEEEKVILEETAAQSAQKAIEEAGLKKPQKQLEGLKETPKEAESFEAKAGETAGERRMRLKRAVHAVSGGGLALEKAPKELRMWRYFASRVNLKTGEGTQKDYETIASVLGVKKDLVGGSGEGAVLVPDEFATDLVVALENYTAAGDCTQRTMASDTMYVRSVDTKVAVYNVAEQTAPTESAPEFTNRTLTAKAFAGMVVGSKEFWRDQNVDAYPRFVEQFAEQLGAKRDSEILTTGSAFTGILGSSTPQTETLVGTGFTDIKYQNLVNVIYKLSDGQRGRNAKFYMHRTVFGNILGLKDDNNRPIVQNPWDAKERSLLGYPVYLSEQMVSTSAAATAFIIFGDLKWTDFGTRDQLEVRIFDQGTFGGVNLGEARSLALFVDERWAFVVTQPSYLAMIKTAAA